MMKSLVLTVAILAAASLARGQTVLWSDTFDRANQTINTTTNDNGSGGTVAVPWESNGGSIASGNLVLSSKYAQPEHNFTDSSITTAGGFEIRFKVDPASGEEWGAINIGLTDDAANNIYDILDAETDFGLGLRGNGKFFCLADNSGAGGDTFDSSPSSGVEWYSVRLRVETTSFALNSPFTANAWVTGVLGSGGATNTVQLDLNGAAAGNTLSSTWTGWGNNNYIEFAAANQTGYFDDTQFIVIPEPSAVSLVGLGMLLMVAARRSRPSSGK